ncbi:LysR family transcriptional regulator [Streptomyces sp. ok210]|uniref:LysR family transcriptional regulator n=1 Tax=Streptomyces sp. ok210 TaxID=1761905 RepID=UPI0008E7DE09|nr:LysR family transcriptional regulator [Streptomyces sp. ok210]SFT31378.1 DNA-binding transcriptional regulator, LysR family [Streptomyces sp. ok210]
MKAERTIKSRNLDVSQLRTLNTIVETGSFRRAADALSLTQPAVSYHIRRLEAVLHGPVFVRTGSRLELSNAGEELLFYARKILTVNDEAIARLTAPKGGLRLTIGVSEQLEDLLENLLLGLTRALPRVTLTARVGASEHLTARTAEQETDIAVVIGCARGERSRSLGSLQLAWYAQDAASLAAGRSIPMVLPAEPCNTRTHIISILDAQGVPWHVAYEGPDLAGLRAATRAGLGVIGLLADCAEKWNLTPVPGGTLPFHPGFVPVSFVHAPDTPPDVIEVAFSLAQVTLRQVPLADDPRRVTGSAA